MDNNKIVVNFQPFSKLQYISVYQDKMNTEEIKAPLDDVIKLVAGLAVKYNIFDIVLCGNESFAQQYKDDIKRQTVFNNSNKIANITIVNK